MQEAVAFIARIHQSGGAWRDGHTRQQLLPSKLWRFRSSCHTPVSLRAHPTALASSSSSSSSGEALHELDGPPAAASSPVSLHHSCETLQPTAHRSSVPQLQQCLSGDCLDQDDALDSINLRPNVSVDLAVAGTGFQEDSFLLHTDIVNLEDTSEQLANSDRVSRMLDHVWETINKLDCDLSNKEEELDTICTGSKQSVIILKEDVDHIRHSSALHKAECEVKRLEWELNRMSKELDAKHRFITIASSQVRHAENKLTEAEILVSTVKKMKEELDVKQPGQPLLDAKFLLLGQQIVEQQSSTIKALDFAEEKISGVQGLIMQLHDKFKYETHLLDILEKEGIIFSQSLLSANQVLCKAEEQISSLTNASERYEKALNEERQAVASLKSFVERNEHELKIENEKSQSLFDEVTSLKEEVQQNKVLLASAARNTEALNQSHKKIEQLTAQLKAKEEQLRSRDILLEEVRDETVKSTEALKLATRIKQDLNISRQKEMEVKLELESQRALVVELQQELAENKRAVQAEQALRKMEKGFKELAVEVDILRKGTEERDEAIRVMKDEVDRNILILSNAAKCREIMRQMQLYISGLEEELTNTKNSELDRCNVILEQNMEQSANSSLSSVSEVFSQSTKVGKW